MFLDFLYHGSLVVDFVYIVLVASTTARKNIEVLAT